MSFIICRSCESPYCDGCNGFTLMNALESGKFNALMNENRAVVIPKDGVVDIVRCKDCKYAPSGTDDGEEQGFGLEWPNDGVYDTNPCPLKCSDGWYSHKPKPDFFCANGARS